MIVHTSSETIMQRRLCTSRAAATQSVARQLLQPAYHRAEPRLNSVFRLDSPPIKTGQDDPLHILRHPDLPRPANFDVSNKSFLSLVLRQVNNTHEYMPACILTFVKRNYSLAVFDMVSPMLCLPCQLFLVLRDFAMVRGNTLELFPSMVPKETTRIVPEVVGSDRYSLRRRISKASR